MHTRRLGRPMTRRSKSVRCLGWQVVNLVPIVKARRKAGSLDGLRKMAAGENDYDDRDDA